VICPDVTFPSAHRPLAARFCERPARAERLLFEDGLRPGDDARDVGIFSRDAWSGVLFGGAPFSPFGFLVALMLESSGFFQTFLYAWILRHQSSLAGATPALR
jgi:hypothetical protein